MKKYLVLLILLAMGTAGWAEWSTNPFYPKTTSHFIDATDDDLVYQTNCDTATGWANGTRSVVAQVTDTTGSEFSHTDGNSIRVTQSGDGTYTTATFAFTSTDITNSYCKVNYYVPDATVTGGSQPTMLAVWIHTGSSKYYKKELLPATTGYHSIEFALGGSLADAGVDRTTAQGLTFISRHNAADGNNTIYYIDSVQFFRNHSTPRLILTFDNADDEHLTVSQKMDAYNYDGMFYVVKDYCNTANHLTTANLLAMQTQGHLICNHSKSHLNWVDTDGGGTDAMYWQMINEMLECRRWLESIGIGQGRFYFANGTGSAAVTAQATLAAGRDMVKMMNQYNYHTRLTSSAAMTITAVNYGLFEGAITEGSGFPNSGGFGTVSFTSTGTAPTLVTAKACIDTIVANDELGVLYFHEIDGTSGRISLTEFDELLAYIRTNNVEVVTFADLMPWNPATIGNRPWLSH